MNNIFDFLNASVSGELRYLTLSKFVISLAENPTIFPFSSFNGKVILSLKKLLSLGNIKEAFKTKFSSTSLFFKYSKMLISFGA